MIVIYSVFLKQEAYVTNLKIQVYFLSEAED